MKKFFTLAAIATLALCACNKSDIDENREAASFVATFDNTVKTVLNEDRSQSWLGGEVVRIIDVAELNNGNSDSYKFRNTSATQSNVATFVADDPSFEFVEGHSYCAYYGGANEANDVTLHSGYMCYTYDSDFLYNPEGQYGLPDNVVPLVCKFNYTGKSTLQSLRFHNVANLLVLRITNNASESKQIGHIQLAITPEAPFSNLFGQSRDVATLASSSDYSSPSYEFCTGFTNNSNKSSVNFSSPTTLDAGETKDFAVFITKALYPMSLTLTATISDQKGGATVGTATKQANFNTKISEEGGHVYVWKIGIK